MSDSIPKEWWTIPCIPPPLGVVSNFSNPVDLANIGYGVVVAAIFITTLTVAARFYSRIIVSKHCGSDDYVFLLGWALFVALCAEIFVEIRDGIGRHLWDIPLARAVILLKHLYVNSILYAAVSGVIKVAIFLQFLRILNPVNQRGHMFWICWTSIYLFSAFYIVVIFTSCFLCRPIAKFWIPWLPGECGIRKDIPLVSAIVNVVGDLVIIALPQRTIWKLKMPLEKKMKVSTIFLVALTALAASVSRLYYTILLLYTMDVMWYVSKMGLWAVAEITITIICSSVPSLHGLIRYWKPSVQAFGQRIVKRSSSSDHESSSDMERTDSSCDQHKSSSWRDTEKQTTTTEKPWSNTQPLRQV